MDERMTLDDVLEQSGVMLGAGKLPTENQLVAWREAIALHLTQPAQAVDVGMVREVIAELAKRANTGFNTNDRARCSHWATQLTRAIGNAQAEGFAGFQIVENADVPDGEIWIYDKSKITTQATPNAHE